MTSPAHPKGANTAGWRVVPDEATEAMVSAGLPHLDGQNNSEVRPVGQSYPGMTADESEAANWRYYGKERLRRAYDAMLAAHPRPDYDAIAEQLHDAIAVRDGWRRRWEDMTDSQKDSWRNALRGYFEGE